MPGVLPRPGIQHLRGAGSLWRRAAGALYPGLRASPAGGRGREPSRLFGAARGVPALDDHYEHGDSEPNVVMKRWGPLVAICLGQFMFLVDGTIVVVALPNIGHDLGASFAELQWVIDAYALVLGAILLGVGSLADLLGRRRVYLAGLIVFALSSLVCGLAPNTAILIAARAVQGFGGAAMAATSIALLSHAYPGQDRPVAFGVWGGVTGVATATGPILGGVLSEYLDWRWIFLVNLPISVVTLWYAGRVIGESRNDHARQLDLRGSVSFAVAGTVFTYALILAPERGWTTPLTLGMFAVGMAMFAVFVLVTRHTSDPVLDLSLFRSRSFSAIMLAAFLCNFTAFGYLAYTSLWLQTMCGLSAVIAGLVVFSLSVALGLTSTFGIKTLRKVPPRLTIGWGIILISAGDLMQIALRANSSWTAVLPGVVVIGLGSGFVLPSLASAVMAAMPAHRAGMAGGALNTFRQLGMAVGVAVLGAVFEIALTARIRSGWHGLVGSPDATAAALAEGQGQQLFGHAVPGQYSILHQLAANACAFGLDTAMLAAGLLALLAGVVVLVFVGEPAHPTGAVEQRLGRGELAKT
ncbi:MAG: MFS transporter [Candidatus Dormibacteraceae bacterium]